MRSRLPVFIAVVVLIISVVGYYIIINLHFRVVSTNPGVNNVATISPFFKINFDRQLSSNGVDISSNPSIIKSYYVSGKVLTINLISPLDSKKQYVITLKKISDLKNEQIKDRQFTFTPSVIQSQDLPKDQAAALLKQQSSRPPSRNDIVFTGTDSLQKYGVSLTQVDDLKQAVFQLKNSASSAVIDTKSVVPVPHDPNSSSRSDSINFLIKIDNTSYRAKIDYMDLVTLRLYLYDSQTNSLVYDSKNVSLDY